MNVIALILAAGRGVRAGGDRPKQYQAIGGAPILRRAIQCFLAAPEVDGVRVVINEQDQAHYDLAVEGLDLMSPVPGGDERHHSALLGLESLTDIPPKFVLIHDAARPFVGAALISRVVDGLKGHHAVIPAIPVSDTLKRVASGQSEISETVDRADLWGAQTPQGFRFSTILEAHRERAMVDYTDDAAVAEAAGIPVHVVEGNPDNFKVTASADFKRAAAQLGVSGMRVGMGFDVHRFTSGDGVVLCGVEIPFERGLEGHSDADVALHAVTDALLGAIGAGDIGEHFPPDDAQWRDADSAIFLQKAARIVAERGARITNVDLTIIGEQPKIGPYRNAMRDSVAGLLELPADRVNIKATTTERLGFTGRREGLAAQAVVGLEMTG